MPTYQLGFDIAEAVIIELATAVVDGAVVGALFGTAADCSSKNPLVVLCCAAIGSAMGVAIGDLVSITGATSRAGRLLQREAGRSFRCRPIRGQRQREQRERALLLLGIHGRRPGEQVFYRKKRQDA